MKSSVLLLNESPLQVLPSLAVAIGLNEAIILQQVHYWLIQKKAYQRDGRTWVYNSYDAWQSENFPFWSVRTIQRAFLRLEEMKLVVSMQFDLQDGEGHKYYTIDYDQLNKLAATHHDKLALPTTTEWHDPHDKMARPPRQNGTVLIRTETNTETTREREKKPSEDPLTHPLADALLIGAGFTADQRETLSPKNYMLLGGAITRLTKANITTAQIQQARKNWWGKTPPNFDQLADEALKVASGNGAPAVDPKTHYSDGREKPAHLKKFTC